MYVYIHMYVYIQKYISIIYAVFFSEPIRANQTGFQIRHVQFLRMISEKTMGTMGTKGQLDPKGLLCG